MAKRKEVLPHGWKLGGLLGEGGYGSVYRCQDGHGATLPYVAKRLNITRRKELKRAAREIDVLQRISHEYITPYHEFQVENDYLYIIMDFITKGSIEDLLLRGWSAGLPEEHVQRYTCQIILGLHYLHSKNIIHRDIKGANILIDATDSIKLADFGISKLLFPSGTPSGEVHERAGTYKYMSPEMLLEKGYGRRTDIWSVGCTIVQMLTGRPPWHTLKLVDFIREIKSDNHPDYTLPPETSTDAIEILDNCFIRSKDSRPYTGQLLKLRFCQDKDYEKRHCKCNIL